MKKIIAIVIGILAVLVAKADYTTLSFKTVGGQTHHLDLKGLVISFSQENLTASDQKASITLPLAQVETMEFTDIASIGDDTMVNGDKMNEETTVYAVGGMLMGTYPSFAEAMRDLPAGVYILKYADGTTLKIVRE